MNFGGSIFVFSRIQLGRHLRSSALWFVALAAPIAARFMVPGSESNYTVITINNARPVLSSSVIGLEIGIIATLVLSPLAYIFLRAGPTRTVPWQVEDACSGSKIAQTLGNWLGDTLALWLILLCLAIAGVIISFFRLPIDEFAPLEVLLGAILIAAPALAVMAALRTFFSARPILRGAGGDVLFFVIWLGGIIMASAYFMPGGNPSAMQDLFGFAASISPAVDEQITSITIGPTPEMAGTIKVDALRGVLDKDFLLSRVFWLVLAAGLAVASGALFKPRLQKQSPKRGVRGKLFENISVWADKSLSKAMPTSSTFLALFWENVRQILTPKIYVFIWLLAAIIGGSIPFTPYGGSVIWLVLLFPLTDHSSRWQSRNLSHFSATFPTSRFAQMMWRLMASIFLTLLICLPALIKGLLGPSTGISADMGFIIIGLPLIITLLGALTRSSFFARLILLLVWYMYFNM